jgi:diadenosine tetraphosphate (Ap4A) HIT family hydrolase
MPTERVHNQSNTKRGDCFLCEPDPTLVFARTQNFFAMLGHGPIGEGYSLIASIEHEPSMLDVSLTLAREVEDFTHTVRERLAPHYGPALVTEHGRVAPCVATATAAYEPHCLHAHRLVFPGWDRLDIRALAPEFRWRKYPSFLVARENGAPSGQYLVCQHADETIDISQVPAGVPRQFFRSVVATAVGRPKLADWRRTRGETQIEAARHRLGLS